MATRKGQMTKTIILAGGMQDDVSEFQQADPSAAYIENGRFRKKDEIEKRLPDTALTKTGLPTTRSPLMLASPKGKSLLTIDDEGTLYTFDPLVDTQWQSKESNVIPFSAEIENSTAAEAGMGICTAGKAADASVEKFSIVAFERNIENAQDLICEVRRPSGDLYFRTTYSGGMFPKIRHSGPFRIPYVYYFDSAGGNLKYAAKSGAGLSSSTLGSSLSPYYGEHPYSKALAVTRPTDVPNGAGDLRPGYKSTSLTFFDCDFGQPTTSTGVAGSLVWLKSSTGGYGQLYIAKMPTAITTSTPQWVIAENTATGGSVPLACAYDPVNDQTGILVSQYNASTATSQLVFYLWDHASDSIVSGTPITYGGSGLSYEHWCKASLVYDDSASSSRWRFAATAAGGKPWIMSATSSLDTTITISGRINTSSSLFTVENRFSGHTLASEATFDKMTVAGSETRKLVFGLEQWTPHAVPNKTGDGNNTPDYGGNEKFSVPALIRPHTTVIVATTQQTSDYDVIATLGAGQNKADNADRSEVNSHLNGAFNLFDEEAVRIVTRNLLQPQDLAWTWTNPANGDRLVTLYAGEAAAKITKLSPATNLESHVYGETTLFASAVPTQYDGVTYGEQSVFDQPEVTYVSQGFPNTILDYKVWAYEQGIDGNATDWYTVSVVTGFADHQGHLHRSAPSSPVWVYGIQADQAFADLYVGFTLPLSAYGPQRDYFAEVYLGAGEGAPHLAAVLPFNPHVSVLTGISVHMHQNVNSAYQYPLRYSEVLYTEGNVLPSDPWPSFRDFVLTSNRMFAISAEVKGTVYYSKLLEENINPEFSAPLVLSLGRNRNLTAIGKIDDKVIVFTDDNEIFAIYDTGPDNTGANGDFVVDQLQTTVGCSDTNSLVEIPEGLMFYSDRSKEFHLLSRDLQVYNIGKPIEDTANSILRIKTALVVPDEHEIRWYVDALGQLEFGPTPTAPQNGVPARPARPRYQNIMPSTGAVVVYNYYYKKWCVFSGQDAQHSALYLGQPTFIDDAWQAYKAAPNAWGEEGHQLTIRSPWIRLNQLQSYGRLDEAIFLAKYLSDWRDNGNGFEAGDIRVRVRYDYEGRSADNDDNVEYDEYLFRANAGDLSGKRVEDKNIGAGVLPTEIWYGRCQFSVTPGRPKCQAVQFEITDIASTPININEPTNYVLGRGFSIAGVDLLYSPKTGVASKSQPQRTSK